VKGFKKCCTSSAVDGTDGGTKWTGSEGMAMLGVSVRQMKAQTVKMETVTLTREGTQNVTHFVYQGTTINSTIFLFGGVSLVLYKYIFPWHMCFCLGGCLRSESSCVRVNMVIQTKMFGSVHIVQKTH